MVGLETVNKQTNNNVDLLDVDVEVEVLVEVLVEVVVLVEVDVVVLVLVAENKKATPHLNT